MRWPRTLAGWTVFVTVWGALTVLAFVSVILLNAGLYGDPAQRP